MQRTDWIDVVLLLTIGVVFQTLISGRTHMKIDFTLATFFLILVIKRDLRMILVSLAVVAVTSALTVTGDLVFGMSLLAKVLAGGSLYLVVLQTRSYFTDQVLQLCVIGVVGTVLHGLFIGLLSMTGVGVSFWGFLNILRQVIFPAMFLNVGIAYVMHVTLQHGEKISRNRYSECS